MSDQSKKGLNFDDIFAGSKKPSLCLDCSYLNDDEEHSLNKVTIDYEDDDIHEYTVRKFSTSTRRQKLVDEGQERKSSIGRDSYHPPLFSIAVLGSSFSGKTSLCHQFTSSTLINMQEELMMDTELGVDVDGWQCRLRLVDLPGAFCHRVVQRESSCSLRLDTHNPMVVLVVFAVDDRRSLEIAGSVLAMLRREGRLVGKVVVLVANKADLVRSRVVTEVEGETLAERYEVGYTETSAGINYNVDQLLVKMVKEIQEAVARKQGGSVKKMSVTERIKDMVGRRMSRETIQEKERRRERE